MALSDEKVSPTEIYLDDTVRVLFYKGSNIPDTMKLYEESTIPRSYSETDAGVAVIE